MTDFIEIESGVIINGKNIVSVEKERYSIFIALSNKRTIVYNSKNEKERDKKYNEIMKILGL